MHIFDRYPASAFLAKLAKNDAKFGLLTRVNEWYQALAGREDPHFGTELDKDPIPWLWELMLADILRDNGYEFQKHKDGPDFSIKVGGKTVWVEAVCPGLGEQGRPDSLKPPTYTPRETKGSPVPIDKVALRISGSLRAKSEKFKQYQGAGRIGPDDICLIALSAAKINLSGGTSLGIRSTLGLGDPFAVFDSKSAEVVREGISTETEITKHNGKEIQMDPFLSGEMSDVAGLLSSENSPYRLQYRRYDELSLVHNPTAKHPLPATVFKNFIQRWPIVCTDGSGFKIENLLFDGTTVQAIEANL